MRKSVLAGLSLLIGACGQPVATDDFSDLAGLDAKSDAFSKKMQLVGSLSYGDQGEADYHNPPRYIAFSFQANGGDSLDVIVDGGKGTPNAWIVDHKFHTLAHEVAQSSGVVELTATLPVADTGLHYVIVREDGLADATFTVHLDGKSTKSYDSCKVDADCVAVSKGGCCPNGWNVAVNKAQAKAYTKDHACTMQTGPCPLYVIDDTRSPECDTAQHRCVMVPIDQIKCGGFTANPHGCPSGYQCKYTNVPDVPGECVAKTCVQNVACIQGSHWDATACTCVKDVCVDNVACVQGSHWDGTQCKCVQDDPCNGSCAKGESCTFCWGSYACLPHGAVC